MKKFDVFGTRYQIIYKDLESVNLVGLAAHVEKKIYIDKNQKGEELNHTFLHELGHCVFHTTGINQTSIPTDVQEIIVENIATAIIQNFDIKPKK